MATRKAIFQQLLDRAGVRIDGPEPWDLRVVDEAVYDRVLAKWSLGFGEAYMDGQWECDDLPELVNRLLRAGLNRPPLGRGLLPLAWAVARARLLNLQSRRRAFHVGERHYDIGNDVFAAMLDRRMVYSCAYWESARDLDEAQEHKLEMICRKLELAPGERLLDIGCGFGGLAAYAAERFGVSVVGLTVSREQQRLAAERCRGLPVEIRLQDYRDLAATERFDKVVSVGMFEHVGPKNYPAFFRTVHRVLADEGLFLLHTIGSDRRYAAADPWIDKYIFPNGKLPAAAEIAAAVEPFFLIEDWHNFGPDYERTLLCWRDNFERAWPSLAPRYGERFRRMWLYYLGACAGFFRSRRGQLWQIVLSKPSRPGAYRSWRPASGR